VKVVLLALRPTAEAPLLSFTVPVNWLGTVLALYTLEFTGAVTDVLGAALSVARASVAHSEMKPSARVDAINGCFM